MIRAVVWIPNKMFVWHGFKGCEYTCLPDLGWKLVALLYGKATLGTNNFVRHLLIFSYYTSCSVHWVKFMKHMWYIFMPYYGLFSCDLHILDLQWRSPLCSLLFCGYYPCVHYFYFPWLIMTSQWVMTLLGMPYCGTTMDKKLMCVKITGYT